MVLRVPLDRRPVGQRIDDLQDLRRQVFAARRQVLRVRAAHERNRRPQVPLLVIRPTRSSHAISGDAPHVFSCELEFVQRIVVQARREQRADSGAVGGRSTPARRSAALTRGARRTARRLPRPLRPRGGAPPGGRSTSSCSRRRRGGSARPAWRGRPCAPGRAPTSRDRMAGSPSAGSRPRPTRRHANRLGVVGGLVAPPAVFPRRALGCGPFGNFSYSSRKVAAARSSWSRGCSRSRGC